LKSKASHNATKVDDETHHVSLNNFISSIFFALTRHLSFSKNKSSHDIAIKVDDKTYFSWPCREGPPACCAFPVPIPAVLATALFLQFPSPGVIENAAFLLFPFLGVIENAMFFQFPFPVVIENAVFFQFPFPGVIENAMLCFSTSFSSACAKSCVFPVPFLFPSSAFF